MFKSFLIALALSATARAYAPCGEGEYEMSVEGIAGIFCVSGSPICMAEIGDGSCPEKQEGLEYGSYCGRVASGVFGCKVLDAESIKTWPPAMTPAPTIPAPTQAPTTPKPPTPEEGCGEGGSPMSIEGVKQIFCAKEPVCVDQNSLGNCPGAQDGLEFGSYCDIVRTGIYGCKPYNGTGIHTDANWGEPLSCEGDSYGNIPVSVVGFNTYCTPHPVCAGAIVGNCPVAQDDLAVNSVCAQIETGVYGCVVPITTED